MFIRRLLLILGFFFVIAGLGLAFLSLSRPQLSRPQQAQPQERPPQKAVLSAQKALPTGTLLREEDILWKEAQPGDIRPGHLLRGEVSLTDFLGAITRRDFAEGEALLASALVKPSDRDFLSAVLSPNNRAVSISVDASQSASGLVLPGDFIDVILTQNFGDNLANAARRSVGETVLRNIRVVAVDRSLGSPEETAGKSKVISTDALVPKTITLELNEEQAQRLFVAMQLGKLQLAVRPLEGAGLARAEEQVEQSAPTWAVDVSPAIREMARSPVRAVASGSTVESSVRRAPSVPVLTH